MAILLKNKSKQQKVYNLPHQHYCKALGECACKPLTTRRPEQLPDGTVGIRETTRMIPTSLSLLAGERRQVPDATLAVPEVQRDIDARVLGMVKVNEQADAPPKGAAPSPRTKKKTRKARGRK